MFNLGRYNDSKKKIAFFFILALLQDLIIRLFQYKFQFHFVATAQYFQLNFDK